MQVDPFIGISDGYQVYLKPQFEVKDYGSASDNDEASSILTKLRDKAYESDKLVFGMLSDSISGITKFVTEDVANQLSEEFVPEEAFMFGHKSILDIDYIQTAAHSKGSPSFDGEFSVNSLVDDDAVSISSVADISRFVPKAPPSASPSMSHIVSVGKLLELALEVAGQVAGTSVSTSPLQYSAMTNQCKAFGTDMRKKFSNWLIHDNQYAKAADTMLISFPTNGLSAVDKILSCEHD